MQQKYPTFDPQLTNRDNTLMDSQVVDMGIQCCESTLALHEFHLNKRHHLSKGRVHDPEMERHQILVSRVTIKYHILFSWQYLKELRLKDKQIVDPVLVLVHPTITLLELNLLVV